MEISKLKLKVLTEFQGNIYKIQDSKHLTVYRIVIENCLRGSQTT